MSRFIATPTIPQAEDGDQFGVLDGSRMRFVPGVLGTWDKAWDIARILNQRVEHPELTRADGKLVTV